MRPSSTASNPQFRNRFSLRALLVVMVLLGVALVPLVNRLRESWRQKAAVEIVPKVVGDVVDSDNRINDDSEALIVPVNGEVGLEEIQVVRRAGLSVSKQADTVNMRVKLWFSADWQTKNRRSPPLIHLRSLGTIEDDTGVLLSTEKRLNEIRYLHGEVRGNTWKSSGDKQGPVISLLLEAPGREAEKITAIKGNARVTLTKPVVLTFVNLAAINGKDLVHSEMRDLEALKLRFAVVEENGTVSAEISAPVNFASPWNYGRLYDWGMMNGSTAITPSSERRSVDGAGVTVEKRYDDQSIKELTLRLVVLEAVERQDFTFDFQDVELP